MDKYNVVISYEPQPVFTTATTIGDAGDDEESL